MSNLWPLKFQRVNLHQSTSLKTHSLLHMGVLNDQHKTCHEVSAFSILLINSFNKNHLKQVLETYGISQNKLAMMMGISRSNIHRWINEAVDPAGDSILELRDALEKINPEAAKAFIRLYLGEA